MRRPNSTGILVLLVATILAVWAGVALAQTTEGKTTKTYELNLLAGADATAESVQQFLTSELGMHPKCDEAKGVITCRLQKALGPSQMATVLEKARKRFPNPRIGELKSTIRSIESALAKERKAANAAEKARAEADDELKRQEAASKKAIVERDKTIAGLREELKAAQEAARTALAQAAEASEQAGSMVDEDRLAQAGRTIVDLNDQIEALQKKREPSIWLLTKIDSILSFIPDEGWRGGVKWFVVFILALLALWVLHRLWLVITWPWRRWRKRARVKRNQNHMPDGRNGTAGPQKEPEVPPRPKPTVTPQQGGGSGHPTKAQGIPSSVRAFSTGNGGVTGGGLAGGRVGGLPESSKPSEPTDSVVDLAGPRTGDIIDASPTENVALLVQEGSPEQPDLFSSPEEADQDGGEEPPALREEDPDTPVAEEGFALFRFPCPSEIFDLVKGKPVSDFPKGQTPPVFVSLREKKNGVEMPCGQTAESTRAAVMYHIFFRCPTVKCAGRDVSCHARIIEDPKNRKILSVGAALRPRAELTAKDEEKLRQTLRDMAADESSAEEPAPAA